VQDETAVRSDQDPIKDLTDSQLPFKLTAPPWRSSTIPMSAFISTVISGFERFYDTPRAVPCVLPLLCAFYTYLTLRPPLHRPALT
jgi:hypothetical protein